MSRDGQFAALTLEDITRFTTLEARVKAIAKWSNFLASIASGGFVAMIITIILIFLLDIESLWIIFGISSAVTCLLLVSFFLDHRGHLIVDELTTLRAQAKPFRFNPTHQVIADAMYRAAKVALGLTKEPAHRRAIRACYYTSLMSLEASTLSDEVDDPHWTEHKEIARELYDMAEGNFDASVIEVYNTMLTEYSPR